MADKKFELAGEILKDPTGDIARLRAMGITDFALMTYMVHVKEGQTKEAARDALLRGRDSLRPEQIRFVREVLARLPIL